ncbi:hypothetical protein [Pedobacter punctiformis]|uniref:POTRA domain-containing protein n=1 Tax=Pedobacter punctiformis TaxID=3004097 RepID=A0ABT4L469_9SPHI|nr:hypothetical protein [Pedobacter sp. HCMS5-2]MCZ4242719.1 hypothetical protein [Pedobacter sp. HCMS5-2]
MKSKTVFIVLLWLFGFTSFAQKMKTKSMPPPIPPGRKEYNNQINNQICKYRNSYSAQYRLKFYPFNKYQKVALISFEQSNYPEPKLIMIDSSKNTPIANVEIDSIGYFPVKNHKFYPSKAKEIKILSPLQINALTNILYNYGYASVKKNQVLVIERFGCYNPRNAILFFDEKDNVAAYIELCFECRGNELSSDKIEIGVLCEGKYDLIKKFFLSAGIKYIKDDKIQ